MRSGIFIYLGFTQFSTEFIIIRAAKLWNLVQTEIKEIYLFKYIQPK